MSIKGRIHSFETFGTLDGPGIRFVVFMQGCPLRCIYCHNRDTWDVSGGEEYTVEEVIDRMNRYMSYIESSGGGITVTGGEPTLQADFIALLFKKCRDMGIHTALDTSGFVSIDKAEKFLEYTSLLLLDIKHAVDEKHRAITGVGNEKIREFARYASGRGIPIWIRYVLIPGFTDSEEDLKLASEFIRELGSVEKVEVLPYHSMGNFKWEKLGEKYPLEGVAEPSGEQVQRAIDILNPKVIH